MTPQPKRAGFLFAPGFRLAADGTLCTQHGAVVALPPKALRTLLELVAHAGDVVTKDALMKAVWPTSFVEETGLTRNICLLRQALPKASIATVPRIGYRFVADVAFSGETA